MPTHLHMAMVICQPVLKRVNRIIRDFLWHGRCDSNGGHCLVNWQCVCRPLEYDGLGILDLRRFGIALRTRWLWLQHTDSSRPWTHLQLPDDPDARAIFRASTSWCVGDGCSCKFWEDQWLGGQSISDIAPTIASLVPRRRRKSCTVAEGLDQRAWISHIQGALMPLAMVEYVELWRRLRHIVLSNQPDLLRWCWTESGSYSAKSCYSALSAGSIRAPHWKLTWQSWAPLRINFFTWLALQDRCWTVARLVRHGHPHHALCLFCDQETETMEHLLVGCPFSRQVWHDCFNWCYPWALAPAPNDKFLA